MDAFIVKQLKTLRKVKPSASWLESQRSFLISEISKDNKIKDSLQERKSIFAFPIFNISKFFKPVFALAMVLIVFASSLGTIGIISAAQNSLPGDPLYVLKTAFEQTQMSLASSDESRVVLSIKFANQRMDEFAQITVKPEKKNDIDKTVKNLTEQLVAIQDNMDKLKEKNIEKAAEVAKLISGQIDNYKQNLIKAGDQLAYLMPEERQKLDQAFIEVNKLQEKCNELKNGGNTDTGSSLEGLEETIVSPSPSFEKINE